MVFHCLLFISFLGLRPYAPSNRYVIFLKWFERKKNFYQNMHLFCVKLNFDTKFDASGLKWIFQLTLIQSDPQ